MGLRRLVELACRRRCWWRRLPEEFGNRWILVSPDAALRWLRPSKKAFDTHLVEAARDISSDDIVWDIGANVGVFALMAAHRSRHTVVAVEADRWLARLIARTAHANGDCSISVLSIAAGARPGIGEFAVASRGRAASGLLNGALSTQTGGIREIRPVRIDTLDGLLRTHAPPTVVKIDVEGSELDVLRGAEKLLRDVRPRLIIEIAAVNYDLACELLAGYRYDLRRVDGVDFEATPLAVTEEAGGCSGGASSPTVRSASIAAYAMR